MDTLMGAWFLIISLKGSGPWDVIGPFHSKAECSKELRREMLADDTGVQSFACASGDGPAGTFYWSSTK